jgi:hypothetical protein
MAKEGITASKIKMGEVIEIPEMEMEIRGTVIEPIDDIAKIDSKKGVVIFESGFSYPIKKKTAEIITKIFGTSVPVKVYKGKKKIGKETVEEYYYPIPIPY